MSRARIVRVPGVSAAALIVLFHIVAAQESRYRTIGNFFKTSLDLSPSARRCAT
jgi:hypothetical protein